MKKGWERAFAAYSECSVLSPDFPKRGEVARAAAKRLAKAVERLRDDEARGRRRKAS